MNPTPTTDIQRLRELLAAATPGPWHGIHGDSYCAYPSVGAGNGHHFILYDASDADGRRAEDDTKFPGLNADADLIAALRNEAPAFLDEVSLHRASLASIRKAAKLDAGESIPMICAVIVGALAERDKLREEVERLQKDNAQSLREAKKLATLIWEAEYKTKSPKWTPLETVHGVISQIDNMSYGISVQRNDAVAERDSLRRENEELKAKLK